MTDTARERLVMALSLVNLWMILLAGLGYAYEIWREAGVVVLTPAA